MEDYQRNGLRFVRRDRFEIVSAIISVAQKPSGLTHIMYHVNLSHRQLKEYLRLMIACHLIKECKKRRDVGRKLLSYLATEKGNRFLSLYCEALTLLHGEHLLKGNGCLADAYLHQYCRKNRLIFDRKLVRSLDVESERPRNLTA